MSWVFAGQGRWARAPGGRRWSSLATVERPRTVQPRRSQLTADTFNALPGPQPTTVSHDGGAPTDHARVCLAVPPPSSATLPMPSEQATTAGTWRRCLSPQLGKLGFSGRNYHAELRRNCAPSHATRGRLPAVPHESPQVLAREWHVSCPRHTRTIGSGVLDVCASGDERQPRRRVRRPIRRACVSRYPHRPQPRCRGSRGSAKAAPSDP